MLAPVYFNPLFIASVTDKTFLIWMDQGIVSIKHLYIDSTFASFEQLAHVFHLQSTHFFRYLQIRDFVCSRFPVILPSALTDTILQTNPYIKVTISVLYNTLLTHQSSASDVLRRTWSTQQILI